MMRPLAKLRSMRTLGPRTSVASIMTPSMTSSTSTKPGLQPSLKAPSYWCREVENAKTFRGFVSFGAPLARENTGSCTRTPSQVRTTAILTPDLAFEDPQDGPCCRSSKYGNGPSSTTLTPHSSRRTWSSMTWPAIGNLSTRT